MVLPQMQKKKKKKDTAMPISRMRTGPKEFIQFGGRNVLLQYSPFKQLEGVGMGKHRHRMGALEITSKRDEGTKIH